MSRLFIYYRFIIHIEIVISTYYIVDSFIIYKYVRTFYTIFM